MRTKPRRDLLEFEISARASEHELEIAILVVSADAPAIHREKGMHANPRETLIAIKQCMVTCERLQ
jgi:hypothetical protein